MKARTKDSSFQKLDFEGKENSKTEAENSVKCVFLTRSSQK